jgi:iron complex transport system substrate-binding protein
MNKSSKIISALLIALMASVSTLGTGSEDNYGDIYTLKVFGNANLDNTIDEKDAAYIDGVIKGINVATNLSDANYDGKIDEEDITQIENIMENKEKQLTIVDNVERVVTLKMPLERVVIARMGTVEEALISIEATDKIVGITTEIKESRKIIAEAGGMMDLPEVGYGKDLDYEMILKLNPDIVYIDEYYQKVVAEKLKELPGTIPVVTLELGVPDSKRVIPGIKMLGVMFGKENEADKVIDWFEKYDNIVKDRTKGLDPEEMPSFYIEGDDWYTFGSDKWDGKAVAGCGGRNIIDNVTRFEKGSWGEYIVDPEWVIEQDPDFIFRLVPIQNALTSEEKAKALLAEYVNKPGWDNLSAVKNDQVYLYTKLMNYAPSNIIGRCYYAKLLQPDLFRDLDPRKIADEYWNTFMGGEYPEMFVYPEPS